MANLLTKRQKKNIQVEYYIRLVSVSVIVFSILCLFLLAYVIPYYISVSKKDLKVDEQFDSVINVENKENIGTSVMVIVNQISDEMKVVELYDNNSIVPSNYFYQVVDNKNSDIKITKLSLLAIKDSGDKLVVSGVANNRNALVTFIEDLKTVDSFVQVESPISDFAQDSNISFTINIKLAL